MGNRLDYLFKEWHYLGGAVLLDDLDTTIRIRSPEEVLNAYSAVTAQEVQAVAQKTINASACNLAIIGPFGRGEELVKLVGK